MAPIVRVGGNCKTLPSVLCSIKRCLSKWLPRESVTLICTVLMQRVGLGFTTPGLWDMKVRLFFVQHFFVYIKRINGDLMADLRSWVCSTSWIWRRNGPDRGFGHSVIFCLPEL